MKTHLLRTFTKLGLLVAVLGLSVVTLCAKPKSVLVVTTTTGFRHSSIETAEKVIANLGQSSGAFTVDYARVSPNSPEFKGADGKTDKAKYEEAIKKVLAETMSTDALKKYDGVISVREFLMADGDDDLSVSRDEYAEYCARTFTKHAKGPMKLSDKDFDYLATEEIEAMWPRMSKYDTDKDGKLSKAELIKFVAGEMKDAAVASIESGPHVVEPDMPPEKEPVKDGK